ncbi:hypothetical protein TCAL_12177 [Tigriopus californicus]|uniref:Uncharacterized protein n=1 Tax=Tigriopus californicus TaxID=6832 RepID=A0A553PJX6_TIGCA|nr:hypothetical protein TCAL_12177 [Tigriopus californicus]|eukprot:TCALIF_12177-PA protein Name:"Protein of unknown function" AED:0.44 eAED:0.55 QI:8/0/0.5/1/1/0.5/2/125/39
MGIISLVLPRRTTSLRTNLSRMTMMKWIKTGHCCLPGFN